MIVRQWFRTISCILLSENIKKIIMYSPFEGRDGIQSFMKAKISIINIVFRAGIGVFFSSV